MENKNSPLRIPVEALATLTRYDCDGRHPEINLDPAGDFVLLQDVQNLVIGDRARAAESAVDSPEFRRLLTDFATRWFDHPGEETKRLEIFAHIDAMLAARAAPSVADEPHLRIADGGLSLPELADEFRAVAELGCNYTISAADCKKLYLAMVTPPEVSSVPAPVASNLQQPTCWIDPIELRELENGTVGIVMPIGVDAQSVPLYTSAAQPAVAPVAPIDRDSVLEEATIKDHPALLAVMDDILTPSGWTKYRADEDISLYPEMFRDIFKAGMDAAAPLAVPQRPTDDELWDATLRDRDTYHEWADKLAGAIAIHFGAEIGEHSNMNCPWAEALEAIESADPVSLAVPLPADQSEADDLRLQLNGLHEVVTRFHAALGDLDDPKHAVAIERIKALSVAPLPLPVAPSEKPATVQGWKLVPIDPTDAMALAACKISLRNPAINGAQQYRAMLAAAPAAPVALPAAVGEWIGVDERLPEVRKNDSAEFIVACRRSNGKTYVFTADYLNEKLLMVDDEDCPEDGKPFTGWYRERDDASGEYDTCWNLVCESGDAITHWQHKPAAPSTGEKA